MGWTFPWASSFGGDFNSDFNVSFTSQQQREEGGIEYNYRREPPAPDSDPLAGRPESKLKTPGAACAEPRQEQTCRHSCASGGG